MYNNNPFANIPPPNFMPIYNHPPPPPPAQNFNRNRANSGPPAPRDRSNSISKGTKRKGNSPPKQARKHQKAEKLQKAKPKVQSAKKSDKIEGMALFVGDVNTIYHLNVETYMLQLKNRFLSGLQNFKCESYTLNATSQADYEPALADIKNQFCSAKHPLVFVVFVAQTNTDLDFETFVKNVYQLENLNAELFVGVLPESPTDMKKLSDADSIALAAHRTAAFTIFAKIPRCNIVTVSNHGDDLEDCGPKTKINRLANRIKAFEPKRNQPLKVQASVPAGRIACLSSRAAELIKKD